MTKPLQRLVALHEKRPWLAWVCIVAGIEAILTARLPHPVHDWQYVTATSGAVGLLLFGFTVVYSALLRRQRRG